MSEITPTELHARLDQGEKFFLLDVREADELEISRLEGIVAIPMATVPDRLAELQSATDPIIVICRTGGRSGRVCEFLAGHGISATNLVTGMNGWAQTVDPSLPVY